MHGLPQQCIYECVDGPAETNPAQNAGTFDTSRLLFKHTIEVESHTSLKNTKLIARFGRRVGLRTAPKTKAAQDFLVLSLQARARDLHLDRPWGNAVRAVLHLEFAAYWTKGKPIRLNRKMGDLTNAIQACEDALTKAGIIEDDSLIVEMQAVKIPSVRNAITVELYEST